MATHARLYPEILFHFTNRDGLFGILEKSFSISYARETIVAGKKSREFGAPMVSFCDLRLSELKSHMDKYGNYGIGLTKDWANKKGLNPVLYMNKHCPSTASFIQAVEKIYSHLETMSDMDTHSELLPSYMNVLNLYRYIKNYEGDLKRKDGTVTRNYRFADEREWRYVPPLENHDFPFVPLSKIATDEDKATLNATLAGFKLHFTPDDIRYLIVETDAERLDLIHHLDAVKDRFDEPTKRRLASRILTSEQIINDM